MPLTLSFRDFQSTRFPGPVLTLPSFPPTSEENSFNVHGSLLLRVLRTALSRSVSDFYSLLRHAFDLHFHPLSSRPHRLRSESSPFFHLPLSTPIYSPSANLLVGLFVSRDSHFASRPKLTPRQNFSAPQRGELGLFQGSPSCDDLSIQAPTYFDGTISLSKGMNARQFKNQMLRINVIIISNAFVQSLSYPLGPPTSTSPTPQESVLRVRAHRSPTTVPSESSSLTLAQAAMLHASPPTTPTRNPVYQLPFCRAPLPCWSLDYFATLGPHRPDIRTDESLQVSGFTSFQPFSIATLPMQAAIETRSTPRIAWARTWFPPFC
ncbi:hypothetical protein C8R43DRAFT_1118412 [Mycena crocata]|nr:hypothetical protein C8R43DRAFT_1118412 [Mycena crocata]